jgi:hypothetical protein
MRGTPDRDAQRPDTHINGVRIYFRDLARFAARAGDNRGMVLETPRGRSGSTNKFGD